jgi:hypothetical protein
MHALTNRQFLAGWDICGANHAVARALPKCCKQVIDPLRLDEVFFAVEGRRLSIAHDWV